MKFKAGTCWGVFAGSLLVAGAQGGCSGGSNGWNQPSSTPMEVGSVSVFDAKVTFYSVTLDGHTDIGMSETGSAFAKRTLVAPLMAQGLTTQEIYLALAPEGAPAPPALVAAQADEAAALNRSADVRHVTVDTTALAEKSLTSCENAIIGTTPPGGAGYYWQLAPYGLGNTGAYTFTNSCGVELWGGCGYYSTDWFIFGGCNEGSTSVDLYAFEEYGRNCTIHYISGNPTVMPVNYYYYWYWHNPGGAMYDIETYNPQSGACSQSSNKYDLVIGDQQ